MDALINQPGYCAASATPCPRELYVPGDSVVFYRLITHEVSLRILYYVACLFLGMRYPVSKRDHLHVASPTNDRVTSKQQRGLSPRSQRSRTGARTTSVSRASTSRHTSGCSGTTAVRGQL